MGREQKPQPAPVLTLTGHTEWVNSVAFSPDGTLLASASGDGTVKLWDAATGQLQRTLVGSFRLYVSSVAFSPDGTQLAAVWGDGSLRVWRAADWRSRPWWPRVDFATAGHGKVTSKNARTRGSNAVAFSPDGAQLATGDHDGGVTLWPLRGGPPRQLPGQDPVTTVVFSPDGRRLVTLRRVVATVTVWDPVTDRPRSALTGHRDQVNAAAFRPDGLRLATASNDETVRVWDPATGRTLVTLEADTGWQLGVAFSPDGTRLATAGRNGSVQVWDATGW